MWYKGPLTIALAAIIGGLTIFAGILLHLDLDQLVNSGSFSIVKLLLAGYTWAQ